MRTVLFFGLFASLVAACGDSSGDHTGPLDLGTDTGATADGGDGGDVDAGDVDAGCATLSRQRITSMTSPVIATAPPGDDRLFVAERTLGRVRIVNGTTAMPTPYLDLGGEVSSAGFEAGILGFAFHPDFATTPKVYATITTHTNTLRVVGFTATSATADTVDVSTETTILDIPLLDTTNVAHIGGFLAFGTDGFLYVGVGDMQLHGDAMNVAQDLNNLRGKILRIDVDGTAPYAIPPGNPFAGMSGRRDEIWAYGFREPFRFSFDADGNLYIGDVGDNGWEEIDVLQPTDVGRNLGWPITEAMHCHTPATGCDTSGLTAPVFEIAHSDMASAILGGRVYAGTGLPACMQGRYFFSDYAYGWVRSFTWDAAGGAKDVMEHDTLRSTTTVSIGVDGHGEIITMSEGGGVDRVVAD